MKCESIETVVKLEIAEKTFSAFSKYVFLFRRQHDMRGAHLCQNIGEVHKKNPEVLRVLA